MQQVYGGLRAAAGAVALPRFEGVVNAYVQSTQTTRSSLESTWVAAICSPDGEMAAHAQFASFVQLARFTTELSGLGYEPHVIGACADMGGADVLFAAPKAVRMHPAAR